MIGKKTAIPVVIVLAAIFIRINLKTYSPIVELKLGKLQGLQSVSRDGQEFFEFLKIPYANPPVRDLRFEPPQELTEKWEEVRDASSYGPFCLQADILLNMVQGDEDCLHLNIHTPKINPNASLTEAELMPVIVFFHGGIFAFGSGNIYGPKYFMDEGVVFVTVNYRLGSFGGSIEVCVFNLSHIVTRMCLVNPGFLNTGDGIIRGNMGLKDQNMALQWIQKNIKVFGGNPAKVTLMGQSAGGASSQFHMLSPMSKGLFHNVIAQSGSVLNPWVVFDKPRTQALRFAEMANCTKKSSTLNQDVDVDCLKKLPASEIINIHKEYLDPLHEIISLFTPTVEKEISDGKTFISQHPKTILKSGNYYKVPIITGVSSNEGQAWIAASFRNKTGWKLTASNFLKYMPRALYLPDDTDPIILNKIIEFYSNGKAFPDETSTFEDLHDVSKVLGDRIFNLGVLESTEMLANSSTKSSPVFLYLYSYKSQFSVLDTILSIKGNMDSRLEAFFGIINNWLERSILGKQKPNYGVTHGDDLFMQMPFNFPLMPYVSKGDADYEFSKNFVKLWADFAKSFEFDALEFMGQNWPALKPGEPLKLMMIDKNPKMILSTVNNKIWKLLDM